MGKKLLLLVLTLTAITLAGTWSWDDSVIAGQNTHNGYPSVFTASAFVGGAVYTCFGDPTIQDIPVIPERLVHYGSTPDLVKDHFLSRLFYVENDMALVRSSIVPDIIWTSQLPKVATCNYKVGLVEYCYGIVASPYIVSGISIPPEYVKNIVYSSIELSADPEEAIDWMSGSILTTNNLGVSSLALCGDDNGYIHLVASLDIPHDTYSWNSTFGESLLYYWRWSAETQNWDSTSGQLLLANYNANYHFPEVASDSEGNLHIVYVANEDISTGQHRIGYTKVSFNNLGEIESIDHSSIPVGMINLSCAAPDIAIDEQDNLHIVYQGHLPGEDWGVFYVKYNGMFWFPNMAINEPSDSLFAWEPAVAVCQDTVHVVFEYGTLSDDHTYTNAANSIGYASKPVDDGGFSISYNVSSDMFYSGSYTWSYVFIGGDAKHNVYPDVIAGDDEVTVIWQANLIAGYTIGRWSRLLARRLLYTE